MEHTTEKHDYTFEGLHDYINKLMAVIIGIKLYKEDVFNQSACFPLPTLSEYKKSKSEDRLLFQQITNDEHNFSTQVTEIKNVSSLSTNVPI